MRNKTVLYQKTDCVGKIIINRPEVDNAINIEMAEELASICHQISIDNAVKVLVVTGAGNSYFSAGYETIAPGSKGNIGGKVLPTVAKLIAEIKCPTIAAINGDALGQGLEIALACDLRIAVEAARFSISHINAGLIPWDGATQRLPRLVGMAMASEMILTGKIIDAEEAFRIGLVNKLVRPEELNSVVDEISHKMASSSQLALNFIKEAVRKGSDLTLEQGLRLESDLYLLLQTTEDRVEGIKAFLEKRPPNFKGK